MKYKTQQKFILKTNNNIPSYIWKKITRDGNTITCTGIRLEESIEKEYFDKINYITELEILFFDSVPEKYRISEEDSSPFQRAEYKGLYAEKYKVLRQSFTSFLELNYDSEEDDMVLFQISFIIQQ